MPKALRRLGAAAAVLSLVIGGLVVLTATEAGAVTLNVPCPGGVGDPATLNAAVTTANGTAAADVIDIAGPCTFTYTAIGGPGAAGSGNDAALPGITQALTIEGHGTTIQRSAAVGVPNMRLITSVASTLTLNDLTIKGGKLIGTNSGAGIVMASLSSSPATLTLNRTTVTGNAGAASGGGISAFSLSTGPVAVALTDSTISTNVITGASSNGGGIAMTSSAGGGGFLTVTTSVISGNQAGGQGAGIAVINAPFTVDRSQILTSVAANGAAITSVQAAGASSTIKQSLIAFNSSTQNNGGVVLFGGTTLIENSTFYLNGSLSNKAGGVVLANNGAAQGLATIRNTTMTDEGSVYTVATAPGTVLATCFGLSGICGSGTPPVLRLANTIIGDTTTPTPAPAAAACTTALGGSIVSDGGNFEHPGATCPATPANPQLAPLAPLPSNNANGGTTANFRLLPSSPAIDAGTAAPCPATDQRGKPRPAGLGCDSGSYEVQPPVTSASGPVGPTSDPQVTISSDPAPGATFECAVGIGAFNPCTNPWSPSLPEGTSTVHVRATAPDPTSSNQTNNSYTDPTPVDVILTVDTVDPAVDVAPVPLPTNDTTPNLPFTVTDASSVTLTCEVDALAPVPCTSTTSHTTGTLGDGSHTLTVTATDAAGNTGSDTESFVVDTTAPNAVIATGPSGSILFDDAEFTFSAPDDAAATFECRLDGTEASFAACDSPEAYSGFAEGSHTFSVRAIDVAGNVGPADSRTFTFAPDTTIPVITVTGSPDPVTNVNDATITYTVSETPVDMSCTLNAAAVPCSETSLTADDLPDGDYTAVISAEDPSGNDAAPQTVEFTVDTVGPVVEITSGPPPASVDNTPTVVFTVDDTSAALTCEVDNDGPVPCTSPFEPGIVTDTVHTITIRATDAAGNVGEDAVSFTVASSPPNTILASSGPTGTVNTTSATFSFTSSEAGSTFECRIDANVFAPCESPQAYTGLTQGFHNFRVRAIDVDGNVDPTPAERDWTIDSIGPTVTIGAVASPTSDNTVAIPFTVDDPAPASVTCEVDELGPVPCSSGFTTAPLGDGSHTVVVTATDAIGNSGQASVMFLVDTTPPDTQITGGPTGTYHLPDATFTFTATGGASSFLCKLDAGAFLPCSSPHTYQGVATGPHTFSVAAIDLAGNVDPTPATRTWTYKRCSLIQLGLGPLGTVCIL